MVSSFYQGWKKFAVIGIGVANVIIIILFILTELGNVASNFFLTNVFAGSWCGLVLLIYTMILFAVAICVSSQMAGRISAILAVVTLVAFALLISFNGVFIAQPSTCIMTTTCVNQSVSQSSFGYNMSQNFFSTFNNLNGFRNYTLSQSKYLFQTIQISFGVLGFVLCIVYLFIYYLQGKESPNQVIPVKGRDSPMPEVEEVTGPDGGKQNRKTAKTTYVN